MNDYKMTSKELRATWGLGAVFSLRMIGIFMILPVLTTYGLTLKGASEALIGLAIGAYGFTQAIFQIPFGFLSDRIGRKPLIVGGLLIFTAGSIIAALSHSIWGVIIGRIFQGSGAIASVIMALLSDLTREQNQTKVMACIGISFGIAFAIAIVIGPLITHFFGFNVLFWIIAILAIIAIFITLFVVPDNKSCILNKESRIIKKYLKKALTDPRLLKLDFSIMCLQILLISTFIVLPKQLSAAGLPTAEHWKVYLVTIIVSLVSGMPFIIYAEVKRCMKYIVLLCIILLLSAKIIFWNANLQLWKLVVGIQIFFFAFNLMEALLPAFISKESSIGYKGTIMGVYSTSQFIGVAIGGSLGGWAYGFFDSNIISLSGVLLTFIWFIVALTIKEPSHFMSLRIKIPNNIKIIESIKSCLEHKIGVKEVLIVLEECSAYVKIDSKITNRIELEQALKAKLFELEKNEISHL